MESGGFRIGQVEYVAGDVADSLHSLIQVREVYILGPTFESRGLAYS